MLLTLSIKVKGTYSNPEIGYVRPLLIKSGDKWQKSNRELIPTTGEVVTFSRLGWASVSEGRYFD